ncbi:GspH/FimT family pseudopilin [Dyella amyloliquefaciens]|uniref:GspH/FimT family pseudopilin n=1 Tax=Dyella amyloliquefaciens TaxID=1770545 RepID=UPI00102E7FDF|nr:GspH/FimT family pseudopilin [Dyella amyloliquefaciens]
MQGHQDSTRGRGFTLIEQIVTTAIVAVLACVAAPALGHLVARNRLQVAQSDIITALQQARALAVQTRHRVMLCPTRDGRQCTDDLHWETGWLTGHYHGDHTDQLDGSPALADGGHEQLNIVSTAGRRRIRFQPDGSAGGSNASFTICRPGETDGALAVTVTNAGRIRGAKATEAQAIRCAKNE